jgi:membrane-associated phospholipid phosphatase
LEKTEVENTITPNGRRTAARLRAWAATRHSLYVEAAAVVGLYAAYETARGLVAGNEAEADRHARDVMAVERAFHVFGEADVQSAVHSLPGVADLLGGAYLTLHLTVTGGLLLWLYKRRPSAFPFARTALLLASAFSLVGFVLYPTAPPRLAGIGIADTISAERIDINHGLVSSLYNPYAAFPSMHIAYALLVAYCLLGATRHRLVRTLAWLYPPAVLLIVVATGNHFFVDAAAGALIAALAVVSAAALTRRAPASVLVPLPAQLGRVPAAEKRAA